MQLICRRVKNINVSEKRNIYIGKISKRRGLPEGLVNPLSAHLD